MKKITPRIFGAFRLNAGASLRRKEIWNSWKSERGSVESVLVLIPLLILFLLAIQIGVAVNFRNMDQMYAQSSASSRAISGNLYLSDQVIDLNSPDAFQKLKLLLTNKERKIPTILPSGLIPGIRGVKTEVHGLAVMESAP